MWLFSCIHVSKFQVQGYFCHFYNAFLEHQRRKLFSCGYRHTAKPWKLIAFSLWHGWVDLCMHCVRVSIASFHCAQHVEHITMSVNPNSWANMFHGKKLDAAKIAGWARDLCINHVNTFAIGSKGHLRNITLWDLLVSSPSPWLRIPAIHHGPPKFMLILYLV